MDKVKARLIYDYSLVEYILPSNPTIMAHAIENKTVEHDEAARQYITKVILNLALVGTERSTKRAKLIDTFMEEYWDFTNKRGMFAWDKIRVVASDANTKAYRWQYTYSLQSTKVQGRLACLMLSKILGIGTAKQNRKQVKAVKMGEHVRTTVAKARKQV
jgi:hypothetical protein